MERTSLAFAMQREFSPRLEKMMTQFNNGKHGADDVGGLDSIDRVRSQLDSVKEIMCENIDSLLERGDKIELLVDKSDRLNTTAFKFERSSRSLKRTMYWQQIKMYILFFVALGLFSLFIALIACGIQLNQCGTS